MKKEEIVIFVSKCVTASGSFEFIIGTKHVPDRGVMLPESGKLPEIDSDEYEEIKELLKHTLDMIFLEANNYEEKHFAYKIIFSDKFIAKGTVVKDEMTEYMKDMIIPVNEAEALFVFSCIPNSWI